MADLEKVKECLKSAKARIFTETGILGDAIDKIKEALAEFEKPDKPKEVDYTKNDQKIRELEKKLAEKDQMIEALNNGNQDLIKKSEILKLDLQRIKRDQTEADLLLVVMKVMMGILTGKPKEEMRNF